jgi:hypothetical protein
MALLPLISNGIVALVAMAFMPSSSWHCCPLCNGIIIIIDVQASLLSLQWHCCPCHDCSVAIDAQVSSPLL